MTVRRSTVLLMFVPFLFAAKCRPDVEGTDGEIEVQDPEVRLQVTSVSPRRVDAGQGFRARILGTGFQSGATVHVGTTELGSVQFQSENTLVGNVGLLEPGNYDVKVTNPDGMVSVLRDGLIIESPQAQLTPACRNTRIFFDLASSSISDDGLETLSSQAHCFELPNVSILIEGHCDERGTTDYNIALGNRRAEAVKRHLVSQAGVSPNRISTKSWGEERPLATGNNEAAWSQNRRVEIILSE